MRQAFAASFLAAFAAWAGSEPAKPQVPVIAGYVHIYEPQGDAFPGPDTQDLKAGTRYPSWQPKIGRASCRERV